jgi:hypothetical protein
MPPRPAIVTARARVGRLLAANRGLVTVESALENDVSRQTLARLVHGGELERWYRGVFASIAWPDSWERRALAAVLAAGPHAGLSHLGAARLHGFTHLRAPHTPPIEVIVLPGHFRRSLPVPVHTSHRLTRPDLVAVDGIACTSARWTLWSLATRYGPKQYRRIVEAAIANGLVEEPDLLDLEPAVFWCAGVRSLRATLEAWTPEAGRTRSEDERDFLRIVTEAGLPPPVMNYEVHDAEGNLRILDAAWPAWFVFAEIDVHGSHATTVGRLADGGRQNGLVDRWKPLRFSRSDLRHRPDMVVAEVRRVLRSAGAPV